jgi:hypothetical protein
MTFRTRLKNARTVQRVGLVFLILAGLSRWFFQFDPAFSERFVDGANGLLSGLAIGFLLVSVVMKSRGRSTTDDQRCA